MLHDLQAEIMDVVWSRSLSQFAISDVHAVLAKRREIAYTTVTTTIARLLEKGLLKRMRDGKRHLYSPELTREEFLQESARETMKQVGFKAGEPYFAMLAQGVSSADESELDELERLITLRRKELGK